MRSRILRLVSIVVSAVVAFAAYTVATPTSAFASPAFLYGMNDPDGTAAVDYAYGSESLAANVLALGAAARTTFGDVYDAPAGRVLAERDATEADFGPDNEWARISVPVTVPNAANRLEFRTWWYGRGSLEVAEIRLH